MGRENEPKVAADPRIRRSGTLITSADGSGPLRFNVRAKGRFRGSGVGSRASRFLFPQVRTGGLQQSDAFHVVRHRKETPGPERGCDPLQPAVTVGRKGTLTCGVASRSRPGRMRSVAARRGPLRFKVRPKCALAQPGSDARKRPQASGTVLAASRVKRFGSPCSRMCHPRPFSTCQQCRRRRLPLGTHPGAPDGHEALHPLPRRTDRRAPPRPGVQSPGFSDPRSAVPGLPCARADLPVTAADRETAWSP